MNEVQFLILVFGAWLVVTWLVGAWLVGAWLVDSCSLLPTTYYLLL
jgi:hypothetical protein